MFHRKTQNGVKSAIREKRMGGKKAEKAAQGNSLVGPGEMKTTRGASW